MKLLIAVGVLISSQAYGGTFECQHKFSEYRWPVTIHPVVIDRENRITIYHYDFKQEGERHLGIATLRENIKSRTTKWRLGSESYLDMPNTGSGVGEGILGGFPVKCQFRP